MASQLRAIAAQEASDRGPEVGNHIVLEWRKTRGEPKFRIEPSSSLD